jgi:hypothetical protein
MDHGHSGLEHEMAHIALLSTRLFELGMIIWAFLVVLCILFPKPVFEWKVKFLNWIIRMHRLGGSINGTPEALRQFRRDLWILLVLILIAIFLLRTI